MMPLAETGQIPPWPPTPDWHPESDVSMLAKYVDTGLTEAAYELAVRETEYLMGDPTYRRLKAVLTAMLDEHGTLDLVDVALYEVAVRNRLADERRGERDELGVLNDWGLSVDEVRAVTPQLNQLAYPGAAPMLKAIANLFGRRRH